MKNKSYIVWCLLTILVNYSFVSHWVWHPDGWLAKLGFVDGAGSVVVHTTAGMSAFVALWKLGQRQEALDKNGNLGPTPHASRPVIHAIGAFFLWYGWFAFNVASPIAYSRGIGDAIGTTALVTVISPISSSCCAFLWMNLGFVPLEFESLLNCLLAGLVSITGMCHTVDIYEAVFVGFFASIIYFICSRFLRNKLKIDDPLQVISIHLMCGIYSGVAEGFVANDVYGTPGLIHGHWEHFGVQCLGVLVIVVFNGIVSWILWEVLLKRVIFRGSDLRVSILDIYLGTRLFDQNYDMALSEVLNCSSNAARRMLFQFHQYIDDRYATEQLDFLVIVKIFSKYLKAGDETFSTSMSAQYILQIVATYIDENGPQCINVSGTQRNILKRIQKQLMFELRPTREPERTSTMDAAEKEVAYSPEHSHSLIKFKPGFYKSGLDISKENVFEAVYNSVWKIIIPHFAQFLKSSYDADLSKHDVKIPFKLLDDWTVEWDAKLEKDASNDTLVDTVPRIKDEGALLDRVSAQTESQKEEREKEKDGRKHIELTKTNAADIIPIVFVDDKTRKSHENEAVVVIE